MKAVLRALVILILISLVLGPLAAVADTVVPLLLILALIWFPGEKNNPRLVRFMPLLWAISFFEALIIMIDFVFELRLFPRELYAMIKIEDAVFAFATAPVLIWFYYRNTRVFKPVLVVCMLLSAALSVYSFLAQDITIKTSFDFIASVTFDAIVGIYLYRKIKVTTP